MTQFLTKKREGGGAPLGGASGSGHPSPLLQTSPINQGQICEQHSTHPQCGGHEEPFTSSQKDSLLASKSFTVWTGQETKCGERRLHLQ